MKCVKRHLIPQLDKMRMRYKEMLTLIKVVVDMVDICRYGNDALTPGHLWVHRHLQQVPMLPSEEKEPLVTDNYKVICHRAHGFWNSCLNEYLASLEKSFKWRRAFRNMQVSDVVLIKKIDEAPRQWPLARVVGISPGSDFLVRLVAVSREGRAHGLFSA